MRIIKKMCVSIFILALLKTVSATGDPMSATNITKKFHLNTLFQENWFKSHHLCHISGTHLASITSKEENDKLIQQIKDAGLENSDFWIDGTNLGNEPNFYWMDHDTTMIFTNWNNGEPNNYNQNENCIVMQKVVYSGMWNDASCYSKFYFICEELITEN